jgi:hypothetical protein
MKSNFTEKINFDVVEEVVPGTKCSQKKNFRYKNEVFGPVKIL